MASSAMDLVYKTINHTYPRPPSIKHVTTSTFASATENQKNLFHDWVFEQQLTVLCSDDDVDYQNIIDACCRVIEAEPTSQYHRNTQESFRRGLARLDAALMKLVESGHLRVSAGVSGISPLFYALCLD